MLGELPETADEQDMEAYEKICRRYNLVHAEEENNQVFFAASMAAWWMAVDMDTVLTYMTQGDERVRAWHLSLEGISFRKSEFPPELIPPIEWGCRCFLVAEGSPLSGRLCRIRRLSGKGGSGLPGEPGNRRAYLFRCAPLFLRPASGLHE